MNFWKNPKYDDYNGIICDGAIRSGKTFSMSLSFIQWACSSFSNKQFAICGKSVGSVRRNVVFPLLHILNAFGVSYKENRSFNNIEIEFLGNKNVFYLFGGFDESSAANIQGITLAGVLFDEVALMPESFVSQAVARCSVKGSKFWFNCNPENPYHWFYINWIKECERKNILYLHFTMDDNPTLSTDMKKRYMSMYSGGFYNRFIKGLWVSTHGLVYPSFSKENIFEKEKIMEYEKYFVSCDYGTINPCSFGLWGESEGKYYRFDEYYYSGKISPKTDNEHYEALLNLVDGRDIETIIIDPSAASFIQVIKNDGKFNIEKADNNIENGIRLVSNAIFQKDIFISDKCKDSLREFSIYRWKENTNKAEPIKKDDHAMDDIRYFVSNILYKEDEEKNSDDFFVFTVDRKEENLF